MMSEKESNISVLYENGIKKTRIKSNTTTSINQSKITTGTFYVVHKRNKKELYLF